MRGGAQRGPGCVGRRRPSADSTVYGNSRLRKWTAETRAPSASGGALQQVGSTLPFYSSNFPILFSSQNVGSGVHSAFTTAHSLFEISFKTIFCC